MAEEQTYTYSGGTYTFPDSDCQLELSKVQRDRRGRLWADARITTVGGQGILALDRGDLTSGRWRADFAAQAAKRNANNPLRWENLVIAALAALQLDPELSTGTSTAPDFMPLAEFLACVDPSRHDLVEGLLERGGLYNLSARYKMGKTILTMNLALASAGGGYWLGRQVVAGPVFWFQLEDSDRVIARRWRRMAGEPPQDIHICRGPFQLSEERLPATINSVKGAVLILVDPLINAAQVQRWADMTEVRQAYDLWRQVARQTNAAVVVTTHHRKISGEEGEQVAGSHQAGAAVDGIIDLRKGGEGMAANERRISFTGRDWPDLEDEIVALDPDTLTFPPVGKYQVRREEADAARADTDAHSLTAALQGEPMAKRKLREVLGWSGARFSRALRAAVEAGLVHEAPPVTDPVSHRQVTYTHPVPGPEEFHDQGQ